MITEERLRQTFSEGGAQEIYQEVKASGDFLGFARQHNRGTLILRSDRISVKNLLYHGQILTFVVRRRKRPTGKGNYPWDNSPLESMNRLSPSCFSCKVQIECQRHCSLFRVQD